MRVAILTVSDSVMKGTRDDTSGQAIVDWCARLGYDVAARETVGDETSDIVPHLLSWCDSGEVDLVLTTGGTGLSPRDVTPEATRAVIERESVGIALWARASSFENARRAVLSRGVAGVRGKTLVINLPGSTKAVNESVLAIEAIIDHAVDVVAGRNAHQ